MCIKHALKRGSQQRRRNSFATHVCDDDGEFVFGADGVVEIASCFTTGKIARGQAGERDIRNRYGHQPLLNRGGDGQLLLITARGLFGFDEVGALNYRRSFGGNGAQDVMADGGYGARGARVQIQRPQDFSLTYVDGGRGIQAARRLHLALA